MFIFSTTITGTFVQKGEDKKAVFYHFWLCKINFIFIFLAKEII